MTQEATPSQEEPKGGVFDSVRQKRSVEIEGQEAPETTAREESGAKPDGTEKSTKPDDRDDLLSQVNTLRSKNTRLEKKMVEYSSWAQFGQAVYGDPKMGKKIAERFEKGQPLFDTAAEAEAFEEATGVSTEEKPMTRGEFNAEMDNREGSRRLVSALDAVAEDQLKDFSKIRKSSKFVDMLGYAQQSVFNDVTPVDDKALEAFPDNEFAAKHYTAIRKAYRLYLADNPKFRKAVDEAKALEDKERTKAASSVPSSMGTTTTSQEEIEQPSDADDLLNRMVNPGGTRKSFRTIGRKTR